jgi:hypothetical protein
MINETQSVVNSFITGTFRVNKNLCTVPAKKGGISMINIKKNFVTSLHCSWIKRASQADIDNWRTDLRDLTGDNVPNADPEQIPRFHPVLHTLCSSYSKFKRAFFMTGKNFFKSNILHNPCLVLSKTNRTVAGTDLFKGNVQNNEDVQRLCANLTILDLTGDGVNFVSRREFEQKTNITYSLEQFSNIQKAVKDSWALIKKNQANDNTNDLC